MAAEVQTTLEEGSEIPDVNRGVKRHYKKDTTFVNDLYTLTYDNHESLELNEPQCSIFFTESVTEVRKIRLPDDLSFTRLLFTFYATILFCPSDALRINFPKPDIILQLSRAPNLLRGPCCHQWGVSISLVECDFISQQNGSDF